jgi:hypothetical protein
MMRRLIVVGLLAAAAGPAVAQQPSPVAIGGWIVGGTAATGRSHDDATNQTSSNASVSPMALRFIKDGLALGGSATAGYFSQSQSHSHSFGVGPSARYYFGDRSSKLLPFASATAAPEWQHIEANNFVNGVTSVRTIDTRGLSLDGSLGLTALIATNVGLTGEGFYTRLTTHVQQIGFNDEHAYAYGVRFGLTVFAR